MFTESHAITMESNIIHCIFEQFKHDIIIKAVPVENVNKEFNWFINYETHLISDGALYAPLVT